jgi:hypothetical protein
MFLISDKKFPCTVSSYPPAGTPETGERPEIEDICTGSGIGVALGAGVALAVGVAVAVGVGVAVGVAVHVAVRVTAAEVIV